MDSTSQAAYDEQEFKDRKEYHRLLRKLAGPNAYIVFAALQDRANAEHEGWCWPSYPRLLEDTGMHSRASIAEALQKLFDLGVMEWCMESRSSCYRPIYQPDNALLELLRTKYRDISFQNRTIDSTEIELSIVSKQNANVNQENVNQKNVLNTTPKGVLRDAQTAPPPIENNLSFFSPAPKPESKKPKQKQQPTAAKPKEQPPPAPPNPNLEHPAIKAWREMALKVKHNSWPNVIQQEMIIKQVKSIPRWEGVINYWLGGTRFIGNIPGLLDVYAMGIDAHKAQARKGSYNR